MALLVAVVETSADEITPHLAHLSVILYSGTVTWLQSQINTLKYRCTLTFNHIHALAHTHRDTYIDIQADTHN